MVRFLPIQDEVRLHVDETDLAGQQPTAVGKCDSLETDIVYGPIERAAQLDEFLDGRRDHFDLRHVFARPRHVVDRLGRAVEIPLARLVEQFQRVLDVDAGRV